MGTQVTLVSVSGLWAQVRDGNITGWMRVSVLRRRSAPER
jgi:hypothetical protein